MNDPVPLFLLSLLSLLLSLPALLSSLLAATATATATAGGAGGAGVAVERMGRMGSAGFNVVGGGGMQEGKEIFLYIPEEEGEGEGEPVLACSTYTAHRPPPTAHRTTHAEVGSPLLSSTPSSSSSLLPYFSPPFCPLLPPSTPLCPLLSHSVRTAKCHRRYRWRPTCLLKGYS